MKTGIDTQNWLGFVQHIGVPMRYDRTASDTHNNVCDLTQEGIFVESEFADRFFWARTHAAHGNGMGAPTIANRIGCSPGLVSNIENHGAKGTKLNDKFAKLFQVDAAWLRDGTGPAPKGFNAKEARLQRLHGPASGRRGSAEVVNLDEHREPRWAGGDFSASDEDRAAAMQKRIFADFQDYAAIVGQDRAQALVEVLTRMTALVQPAAEKPKRNDD